MRARVSSLVKGDWQVHENRLSARACRDSLMRSETCGQERELNLVHIPRRNLPLHVYASVTEYWLYTSMIPRKLSQFQIKTKEFEFPTSFLCFSLPRPRSFCSRSNSRVMFISDTKVRMRLVRPWFISSSVKRVVKATSSSLNESTNNRERELILVSLIFQNASLVGLHKIKSVYIFTRDQTSNTRH